MENPGGGARRKRAMDIGTNFTTRVGVDYYAQMASRSAEVQRRFPKGAGYAVRCDAYGFGAEAAYKALVVDDFEVFASFGHTTNAPYGQAFCVCNQESHLKPTPAQCDPDRSGQLATGVLFFYLQDRNQQQAQDLSDCELAFFCACVTADAGTIAPMAAGSCRAQNAVGFVKESVHCGAWRTFLHAFWRKWGVHRSIEEALAFAEFESAKYLKANPDSKYGDCGIYDARLFASGSTTGINPDPAEKDPNDPTSYR